MTKASKNPHPIRLEGTYYTVEDSALLMGVEQVTVYNYIRRGKVAAVKTGRDYLLEEKDIRAFNKLDYNKKGGRPRKNSEEVENGRKKKKN